MTYVPYVNNGKQGQQQSTYSASSPSPSAYQPSSTTYQPSASASVYKPSTSSSYQTSSASAYRPSSSATNTTPAYMPSSSSTPSYNPSAYSSSSARYSPYNGASTPARASPPPFSQALDNPPPVATTSSATFTKTNTYAPSPPSKYEPTQPIAATAVATPLPSSNAYQHGSGPTHGVMTQSTNPTICHKVDYEIKGSEMQLVEVLLDPGETVIAEAGAMMYLEDDVDFKAKFGDGSNPTQGFFGKLMAAGGRIMTGESLFVTHFTNRSVTGETRRVAFAAPYPGTILPLDMLELQQQYKGLGEKPTAIICQKDAFLCAAFGTKLSTYFHKRIGTGLFGGEGFILQKLKGDGMVFCHAGGCVIKKELRRGQKLRVDTGCLVAFTHPGIDYSIQMVKGLKSMFFGGEGLFLATLEGEGTVWLQSLPFSRLADRIIASAPSVGGRRTGEGSVLTGQLGDLIDGDGFGGFR